MPYKNLEDRRANKRAWKKKNPEKIAANQKRYIEKNREKILEYRRNYWKLNKEKRREVERRYRKKYPEKWREKKKRYYKRYPEKLLEHKRGQRLRNLETSRARAKRHNDKRAHDPVFHERQMVYMRARAKLLKTCPHCDGVVSVEAWKMRKQQLTEGKEWITYEQLQRENEKLHKTVWSLRRSARANKGRSKRRRVKQASSATRRSTRSTKRNGSGTKA